jgi:hypothetical protein
MSILFELRYPSRWYTKLFMAVLSLAFFAVLATAAIAGFLLYRIVKPQRTSSDINMESFPGRPDAVEFTVAGLGTRQGWFFPGLRGAPTIVLCHGYESSRGELLTMVSALQDHQYNVFVFDFAAHGGSADPARFGLWGYNLGAYAALREAENDKRVRAMVLDSVYEEPEQMVKIGVEKTGLGGFPLMVRSAQTSFQWLNYKYREDVPVSKKLKSLSGVPTLYIQALDDPELAKITRDMFLRAPEPRDQAIIPHGNFVSMGDDDKREYENRVVSFFLLKLPATGSGLR